MTIAFWSILAAALLPYLSILIAKAGARGFDNHQPRTWYQSFEGYRQRAIWAQQNSFEIFPLFAAAILLAHLAGAEQARVDGLAIAFVASRLAYIACYLADLALVRSLVWTFGLLCCVMLFVVSA